MIVFPNAKINLGLHIVDKRADGYHNLETIFYPIPWNDALEIHLSDNDAPLLQSYGKPIPSQSSNNLCIKAWQLLHQHFQIPPVNIHLLKAIPMGAGLGGGSSNAAFTLIALNRLFRLQLSSEQLIEFAAVLGSDCAFFIHNQPCRATGRGEILHPLSLSLKGYQLVLVHPGIHIPTPWAFQQITPQTPAFNLSELSALPLQEWRNVLTNQFEPPVFKAYPAIEAIKATLYEQGALYAALSGSGSCCFGIFPHDFRVSATSFEAFETKQVTLA